MWGSAALRSVAVYRVRRGRKGRQMVHGRNWRMLGSIGYVDKGRPLVREGTGREYGSSGDT